MKWRCVNDKFGYCSGEPEWEVEPTYMEVKNWNNELVSEPRGGVCKNSPRECKKHKTLTQVSKVEIS